MSLRTAVLGFIVGATAAVGAYSRRKPPDSPSPFVYRELTEGLVRRQEREGQLLKLLEKESPRMATMRNKLQACSSTVAKSDEEECLRTQSSYDLLQKRLRHETAQLTWGTSDDHDGDIEAARKQFLLEFGCTGWTEEALEEIKKHSPVVEVGAGYGQWARALRKDGIDIMAYDNFSSPPTVSPAGEGQRGGLRNRGGVLQGDETILIPSSHRRSLLVVYPEGDLLLKCLRHYTGDILLYVGEGTGGVNGGDDLFDVLEKEWEVVKVTKVKPFMDGFERLWTLRRKRRTQT